MLPNSLWNLNSTVILNTKFGHSATSQKHNDDTFLLLSGSYFNSRVDVIDPHNG